MINYQEEIKHFKPSLDVDNIEDAIAGMNLTDMNDLMMQLVHNASAQQAQQTARRAENSQIIAENDAAQFMEDAGRNIMPNADDGYVNEG